MAATGFRCKKCRQVSMAVRSQKNVEAHLTLVFDSEEFRNQRRFADGGDLPALDQHGPNLSGSRGTVPEPAELDQESLRGVANDPVRSPKCPEKVDQEKEAPDPCRKDIHVSTEPAFFLEAAGDEGCHVEVNHDQKSPDETRLAEALLV